MRATNNDFVYLKNSYYKALESVAHKANLDFIDSGGTIEETLEKNTTHFLKKKYKCVISGISGSGKTTVTKVLESFGYKRLKNITTRPIRPGESNSDYIFVDESTFNTWNRENKIYQPHLTNGYLRGILKTDMEDFSNNSKQYMDKSVKSAINIFKNNKDLNKKTTFIYILAPDIETLINRLIKRENGRNNPGMDIEEINARLDEEIEELYMTTALPYSYIVNDSMARVEQKIKNILNS